MTQPVTLPRELARSLRVGQLLRVERVGDSVCLTPVQEAARYIEPEVYVGTNWDGLSLEVPPARIHDFLLLLGKILQPCTIRLYFRHNGEDKELGVSLEQYADALAEVGLAATDRHFMAEYDGHTLYAGGKGCFSLQTTLAPDQLRRLGQAVLDVLGVDHYIERDEFQVALIDGKLEVYR